VPTGDIRRIVTRKTIEIFIEKASRIYEQKRSAVSTASALEMYVSRWLRWAKSGIIVKMPRPQIQWPTHRYRWCDDSLEAIKKCETGPGDLTIKTSAYTCSVPLLRSTCTSRAVKPLTFNFYIIGVVTAFICAKLLPAPITYSLCKSRPVKQNAE
jgi:hypothetical protein